MLQNPLWFGKGGWLRVHDLETQVAAQREVNSGLRSRNDALMAEVRDLKQGYDAIEERARAELGMIRNDEVFFQVLDAPKAAYEVSDLYVAIMQLMTTNLRTVMGGLDLDETLSKRDQINAQLLSVVDLATEAWGVKVTRVELKDIRPPADIVNAMTRQMKAEREKRATILESEAARQNEINRAEGLKQAQILEAEGRKASVFLDAEARERSAAAEAKATQLVSDAIAGGNTKAINYFVAQKYVEAISQFATSPNAKTILFPVEATALIGTLGGIGELAKDALGKDT